MSPCLSSSGNEYSSRHLSAPPVPHACRVHRLRVQHPRMRPRITLVVVGWMAGHLRGGAADQVGQTADRVYFRLIPNIVSLQKQEDHLCYTRKCSMTSCKIIRPDILEANTTARGAEELTSRGCSADTCM